MMKNSRALKMSLQKFSWFIESAYICIFEVILAWTGAKIYWNQNKVTYILNSNTVLCISSLAISKIWQRKQVPDRKIAGKTVGVSNFFDVSERKKNPQKVLKKPVLNILKYCDWISYEKSSIMFTVESMQRKKKSTDVILVFIMLILNIQDTGVLLLLTLALKLPVRYYDQI